MLLFKSFNHSVTRHEHKGATKCSFEENTNSFFLLPPTDYFYFVLTVHFNFSLQTNRRVGIVKCLFYTVNKKIG